MINWIRRWIKRRKMAPAIRNAAIEKLKTGDITVQQYNKLIAASESRDALNKIIKQIEVNKNAYGEIDWKRIYDWVQENLIPLLRIIIPIVIMLLETDE